MLLLTEGPHLYYVDAQAMVLKGEIKWYVIVGFFRNELSKNYFYRVI